MKIRRCRVDDNWMLLSTAAMRTVIAIVTLFVGCTTPARAAAPRSSLVVAQRPSPPAGPGPGAPIALPRPRDYEAISELRDIYFEFGKADVRPGDLSILDANAAWLRGHPSYLVLIEGHCDSRGVTDRANEFNLDLGERRAQAARSYLIAHGIDPSRITILSYGQERPQCAEQSERCWSQNRRSRFLVKPR